MDQSRLLPTLIGGLIVIGLIAFRARRLMREQPLNLSRLWILPGVLTLFVLLALQRVPFRPELAAFAALAALMGAGVGWLRAKTMHIAVRPETGQVTAKGSATSVIFLLAILLARYALRFASSSGVLGASVQGPALDVCLLVFACALLIARAAEMTLRGRELLARAAGAP